MIPVEPLYDINFTFLGPTVSTAHSFIGALTLKPLENEVRQWELFENEGLDATDSFGTSIRLAGRENRVFFVEPYNPDQPWITDRGRMFFEGAFGDNLVTQKEPLTFFKTLNQLPPFFFFFSHLKFWFTRCKKSLLTVIFKRASLESLNELKLLEASFSFVRLRSESPFFRTVDLETSYQLSPFSSAKVGIASLVLMIGSNPRYEGYVFNLILRQRYLKGGFAVMILGPLLDLTISSKVVGSTTESLRSICEGAHPACQLLEKADLPIFLTNSFFFRNPSSRGLDEMLSVIKESCESSAGGYVMSDRIELPGSHSTFSISRVSPHDFFNSKALIYTCVDFGSSSELKSLVNHSLLNPDLMGQKSFFNIQEDTSGLDKDMFDHAVRNWAGNKRFFSYFSLPARNFFEESASYVNAVGISRKSLKVTKDPSDSRPVREVIRQITALLNRQVFLFNQKDSKSLDFPNSDSAERSDYFGFLLRAVYTITQSSNEIEHNSTPFEVSIRNLVLPFKPFKNSSKILKLKYWLDDFFVGGGKDALSELSSTLIKSSKSTRFRTTNFF